jgi:hypothetical protein
MSEVERLLRTALVPVEPPTGLTDRLEARLTALTDAAVGELAVFDSDAMRDPRNWARPVAAAVVIGVAGAALVVVRARQQHKKREAHGLRALEQSITEVSRDFRKRLSR